MTSLSIAATRWFAALAASAITLAGATAAAAASCNGRPCVNVGAFNIKLLGNGGPADVPGEYDRIGDLLANAMDLDVLVLEEINVASAGWRDLRRTLEGRGYAIAFESPFGGERQQHIVVAYRASSVTLLAPRPSDLPFPTRYDESGSGCAYANVRPPVSASFRAGAYDFQVLGVHLKSQLPVSGGGPRCDDRIRRDQAKRIVDHLAAAGGEPDIVILGDFNSDFAAPENDPFRAAGMRSAMADRASGSGTISYVGSPRGLIDQIVVRQGDANYVPGSGWAYPLSAADRGAYVKTISDHVPVRASFYTDSDQD